MDNIKEKAQNAWEAGKDALQSVAQDRDIQNNWQHALEEVKDAYDATKETAKNVVYVVKDKAKGWNDNLCNCVSRNPWTTIALSALVGWMVGKFAKFNFNNDNNK